MEETFVDFIRIGDKISSYDGGSYIINDIWVEDFHRYPEAWLDVTWISLDKRTGNQRTSITNFKQLIFGE